MAGGFSFRLTVIRWSDVLQKYAFFIMQDYLTNVWGLSFTHAAGILNIWEGIQRVLPFLILYCIDEFSGDRRVLLALSMIANTIGLGFIAVSKPPVLADMTGTCKQYESECIGHTQKILFYFGMSLIAVGIAGRKVIKLSPDDDQEAAEPKSNLVKSIAICLLIMPRILAVALPNITLWSIRFGIPAIFTVLATCFFLGGLRPFPVDENHERTGSPITTLLRVFVACTFKRIPKFVEAPAMPENSDEYTQTRCLRCLDKAAIPTAEDVGKTNRWRLCSVSEVEEAKLAIRLVPLWLPLITCGIFLSIGNTYFVEQATHLRSPRHFTIPALLSLIELNTILAKKLYELPLNIYMEIKKAPIISLASTMIISIGCCIAGAKIEERRLHVISNHGLLDQPDADIPMTMSVFWMLLPFSLLTSFDAVLEHLITALLEEEAPKSAKSYIAVFSDAVLGLGYMLSVLSVYVVGQVSQRGGNPNWFQFTLNRSRLDKYYWVLTVLCSMNLIAYSLGSCVYGNRKRSRQMLALRRGQVW